MLGCKSWLSFFVCCFFLRIREERCSVLPLILVWFNLNCKLFLSNFLHFCRRFFFLPLFFCFLFCSLILLRIFKCQWTAREKVDAFLIVFGCMASERRQRDSLQKKCFGCWRMPRICFKKGYKQRWDTAFSFAFIAFFVGF